MASDSDWLKLSEPADNVLLIELNRKPVNAISTEFWLAYGKLFDNIASTHPHIRVIIVASALPKTFTAGLDLNAKDGPLHSQASNADPFRRAFPLKEYLESFQRNIGAPERCHVPVIAAINGISIGLAIDMVAACDVRFASSDTQFSIKEVDVGLAADVGTLAYLPKITGNQSLLRELAFSARSFSALEAEKFGLISRVVEGGRAEVIQAALDWAKGVARKSPVAITGTKRLLLHSRDHTVAENLEYTALWNSIALQSDDVPESFKAFKTKQAPIFPPLWTKPRL